MKYNKKEKYMSLALAEAKKAMKKGEVPVGCVIVKDDVVIARGHNLRETKRNSLMHAELIAINKACKKIENFRLEDCDMYVTLEPCLMCAGAIVQSRIRNVYFGAMDNKYGAVYSVANAFEIPSNHHVKSEAGILEEKCSEIISSFFRALRTKKSFK